MKYNHYQTTRSDSESSSSSSSVHQSTTVIPLYKLIPAKQILSKQVQGDLQPAKIKFKYPPHEYHLTTQTPPPKISQTIQNPTSPLNPFICFQKQDTLGYHYQSHFSSSLIYSRTMALPFSQWQDLITYNEPSNLFKYCAQYTKFLAGLFIKQQYYKTCKISQSTTLSQLHLLTNNFHHLNNLTQTNYQPHLLTFSANYPSANLMYAFKTSPNQFSLILHNDTNSKGSTQWFNFQLNLPPNHQFSQIKFNIVNLTKSSSIYTEGMKILYKQSTNNQWIRLNTTTQYLQNSINIQSRKSNLKYKTLSFTYDTRNQNNTNTSNKQQTVYFAYGYPYTFQQNHKFWSELLNPTTSTRKKQKTTLTKQTIGHSSSGLPIQLYKLSQSHTSKSTSLTNYPQPSPSFSSKATHHKSIIFLARQHSGQSQTSYILQGLVSYIVNSHLFHLPTFKIKTNYTYYFIPIVNVQGVLFGNYRTNIKGYDLNRNWRNPSNQSQPQIVAIKKYLQKINKQHQISLIIDLHGHSNAFNSFFYGVENQKNKYKQNCKIFPYYCSKKMKQISFLQSCFHLSDTKKNTARAVLSQLFPKSLVYVLQNSFYGYKTQDKTSKSLKIIQYTPQQLRKLGRDLISTYFQYLQLDQIYQHKNTSLTNRNFSNKQILLKQIQQLQQNPNHFNNTSHHNLQADQSDSQAQDNLLDIQQPAKLSKQPINQQQTSNIKPPKQKKPILNHRVNSQKLPTKKFSIKKQSQGFYLKTIQMVDTTRQQLNDSYFLHKYVKDKQKPLRSKPKKPAYTPIKTQQRQNSTIIQFLNSLDSKKQVPLLSINVLRPSKILAPFSLYTLQNSPKLTNTSAIKYINDKQLVLQQIMKKRKSQDLGRKNIRNKTVNVTKKKINMRQSSEIQIDKFQHHNKTVDTQPKPNPTT